MKTKFTIITPVHNDEKYIEETILSVLTNVDLRVCEYIVVNDGSTDGTRTILEKYENKIRIIDQENQGEAYSVNTALQMANGEYSLIISSDDPLFSNTILIKAAEIMDMNNSIVCVYPDWRIIDSENKVVEFKQLKPFSKIDLIQKFNCVAVAVATTTFCKLN